MGIISCSLIQQISEKELIIYQGCVALTTIVFHLISFPYIFPFKPHSNVRLEGECLQMLWETGLKHVVFKNLAGVLELRFLPSTW